MTDAISRSALMRSLEEAEQRVLHDGEWPYTASVLVKTIVKVKGFVAELPALDVAPVVHARWAAEYRAICSACKTQFDDDVFWIQGGFTAPELLPQLWRENGQGGLNETD